MSTFTRIPFLPAPASEIQSVVDAAADLAARGLSDVGNPGKLVFAVLTPSFLSSAITGSLLATLADPFAGRGLGSTTYATFGTVPAQLALDTVNGAVVAGSASAVAGTSYAIGIKATSGDGKRVIGAVLSLAAVSVLPGNAINTGSPDRNVTRTSLVPAGASSIQSVKDATADLQARGYMDTANPGKLAFVVRTPTFAVGQGAGTVAALLSDPFAGMGLGTTTWTTFGAVPAQLSLDTVNGVVMVGSTAGVAGQSYSIGVLATAGDGSQMIGEYLTLGCADMMGPIVATVSVSAAAGSAVATIVGLKNGDTVASISPNDGRVVIAGGGTALVTGLTASSAGRQRYVLTTASGLKFAITVAATISAVVPTTVIASASVRARIGSLTNTAGASNIATYRSRHRSNVKVTDPYFEWWNGYVNNGGTSAYPNASPETNCPATTMRWSLVLNPTGTGLNAGGTLYQFKFLGMLQDAAFVAAGGTVSADGYTISVPAGYVIKSDPIAGLTLNPTDIYLFQVEDNRAQGAARPFTHRSRGDLGEGYASSTTQPTLVASTNWTGGQGAGIASNALVMGPHFVWGTAAAGTKVVCIDGDSIISENNDDGDADGALAFAKRALNAAGYSFYDVSVPGTNMTYVLNFNAMAVRKRWLNMADVIFSNHVNNDVGPIGWDTNANSLKTLLTNHNAFLRANAKAGVRVVRCTANVREGVSTDMWTTIANQSYGSNTDDRWGLETYARYGMQINLLRLGAYQGTPLPAALADAVYDFHTALGAVDDMAAQTSKWPVTASGNPQFTGTLASAIVANTTTQFNVTSAAPPVIGSNLALNSSGGSAADNPTGFVTAATSNGDGTYAITMSVPPTKAQAAGVSVLSIQTREGTHPTKTLHIQAANDLQPKLSAVLGF